MGYLIEIQESKVEKLSDHIEKGLRHIGKAMQCVDEWIEGDSFGERRDYYGSRYEKMGRHKGMKDHYGSHEGSMGYRDDEDDDDDYEYMGHRRRRDSMGRYR